MSNNSSSHTRITRVSKAIDTDWFDSDLGPSPTHHQMWVWKHSLQIHVTTATVINLQYTIDSITQTYDLSSGVAQPANAVHIYDIMLPAGATYNIQHKTGNPQNVSCIVAETKTSMIG